MFHYYVNGDHALLFIVLNVYFIERGDLGSCQGDPFRLGVILGLCIKRCRFIGENLLTLTGDFDKPLFYR
jgi:hypothetical protein